MVVLCYVFVMFGFFYFILSVVFVVFIFWILIVYMLWLMIVFLFVSCSMMVEFVIVLIDVIFRFFVLCSVFEIIFVDGFLL